MKLDAKGSRGLSVLEVVMKAHAASRVYSACDGRFSLFNSPHGRRLRLHIYPHHLPGAYPFPSALLTGGGEALAYLWRCSCRSVL